MIRINVPVEQIVEHIREAWGYKHCIFVPIGDMKDYWDKTVNYGYKALGVDQFLLKRIDTYKNLIDKDNLVLIKVDPIYYQDDDYITFEFDSEEEVLYFKLKFCS